MPEPKKIIQQWQFLGKIPPKLLEDEAFEYCKKAGITSLQSYFFWSEIEREPGKIDFSSYDTLVEKLKKHNLKWVPFFILGPSYATPDWFKKSDESVFSQCLEHKKESKIQSIWNPFLPKWVDRFLKILSEHYQDKDILESICLGISGNWGEAIFPAKGDFQENFHTHLGWWCGDKYAFQSFRKYALEKYGSLGKINNIWKTNISKIESINFPKLRYYFSLSHEVNKLTPPFLKPALKSVYSVVRATICRPPSRKPRPLGWGGRHNFLRNLLKTETNDTISQQQWLDFIEWYTTSMTNWADFWLETARKYFPNNEIYLVTGGNGNPMLGADFSSQTKAAAKHNGGIRITNQTADYAHNFALNRLISSASKFYGSYFTTEEGMINIPESIPMRIFDTTTSGAKGFYCKNIIGTGNDICSKKFFPLGQPTKGAEILSRNRNFLNITERAVVETAVFYPNTAIALEPIVLDYFYNQCAKLRDVLDFDLIDENMIRDDVLKHYKFFATLESKPLSKEVMKKIEKWIESGGIFISQKSTEDFQQKNNEMRMINQGYRIFNSGSKQNYLKFIKKAVYNQEKKYPWPGIPAVDETWDGVYITRFSDKIIYYNANNFKVRKKVELENLPLKFIDIEENSIICTPL